MNRPDAVESAKSEFYFQSYEKDVQPVGSIFVEGCSLRRAVAGREAEAPAAVQPEVLQDLQSLRRNRNLGNEHPLATRIPAAVHEATRTRRLSAGDRYVAHRAYPSPRGIFGVDVEIQPCTTDLSEPHRDVVRSRISVSAHPARYPRPYGRLRPSLALLEAGHVAATVGMTLSRAGVHTRTALGQSEPAQPPQSGSQPAAVVESDSRARLGPAIASEDVNALSALVGHPTMDLRGWLDLRSSGPSGDNLITSQEIEEQCVMGVRLALARALTAAAINVPVPHALRLYEHWLEGDSMQSRKMMEIGGAPTPRPMSNVAAFSSARGFTLTANFELWAAAYGSAAASRLHTTLGWIMQWGCLAAAGDGLTARPARNFDETTWEEALRLPPNETPCYQLWLRTAEPAASLFGAWSQLGIRT